MPLEPSWDYPSTVGELHNMIEERFGKLGWAAFVQCWQLVAGITQAARPNHHPNAEVAPLPQPEAKVDGKQLTDRVQKSPK